MSQSLLKAPAKLLVTDFRSRCSAFASCSLSLRCCGGILTLFKLFFYTIPNNKKKSGSSAPVNNSSVQKIEMNGGAAAAVLEPSLADSEIIAAITAAIEAFRSQSGSVGGFRVVSFKKRK